MSSSFLQACVKFTWLEEQLSLLVIMLITNFKYGDASYATYYFPSSLIILRYWYLSHWIYFVLYPQKYWTQVVLPLLPLTRDSRLTPTFQSLLNPALDGRSGRVNIQISFGVDHGHINFLRSLATLKVQVGTPHTVCWCPLSILPWCWSYHLHVGIHFMLFQQHGPFHLIVSSH